MEKQAISFLKPSRFFGNFYIGTIKEKYSGHLVYTPNKDFYLDLVDNNSLENIFIDKIKIFKNEELYKTQSITGSVVCEENGFEYNIKLINPKTSMPFSGLSSVQRFFFEGLILTYNTEENSKLKNIEIKFTGFDKFCCSNIYTPNNKETLNVKLKNKRHILLNYSYQIESFNESFIKKNISAYPKTSDKESLEVINKLIELIKPYEDNLILKGSCSEYSLLVEDKFKNFETLVEKVYELKNLFMCLSRHFKTNIDVLQLNYENYGKGYILFFDEIIEKENFIPFPLNPFWLNSFNNSEWKIIFENLLKKFHSLKNFFSIIVSNSRGKYISPHSLVKSIDGLKAIKHKSKKPYSDAINDFKIGLNKKEQAAIDKKLARCLNYVKIKDIKSQTKDKLGIKISQLRAYVEHFYDYPNQEVRLETLGILINMFDLVICDYILKEIGISEEKRLFYKQRVLQMMRIIPYK